MRHLQALLSETKDVGNVGLMDIGTVLGFIVGGLFVGSVLATPDWAVTKYAQPGHRRRWYIRLGFRRLPDPLCSDSFGRRDYGASVDGT